MQEQKQKHPVDNIMIERHFVPLCEHTFITIITVYTFLPTNQWTHTLIDLLHFYFLH